VGGGLGEKEKIRVRIDRINARKDRDIFRWGKSKSKVLRKRNFEKGRSNCFTKIISDGVKITISEKEWKATLTFWFRLLCRI